MSRITCTRRAALVGLAACALVLPACDWFYQRYSSSEEDALIELGKEAFKAFVNENMPGATIADVRAHTYDILGGPSYLTDYVEATVTYEGVRHALMINTATADAYERADMSALAEAVGRHLGEAFGIEDELEIQHLSATLYVPYSAECTHSKDKTADGLEVDMLPYGTEDLDAFVTDAASRPPIYISAQFSTAADVNPRVQTLEDVYALTDDWGLYVSYLDMESPNATLYMYNRGNLEFEHYRWFDVGDLSIYVCDQAYGQTCDTKTDEITTVFERSFEPDHDVLVEESDRGYRITRPTGAALEYLSFGAPEGSPLLNSSFFAENLNNREDALVYLMWGTSADGRSILLQEDGEVYRTLNDIELVHKDASSD